MEKSSHFDFLNENFSVLTQFRKIAEEYLRSDFNACLMKLGMMGETIISLCFTYDKILLPYDNTTVNRINDLFRGGMISRDLADKLYALRKNCNRMAEMVEVKAIHFDKDGRFKAQGGFAKINKVFGNKLESIILELNEYLYDDGGEIA